RDFDVVNMSLGGILPFDSWETRAYFATTSAYYRDAAENGRGGLGTVLVQAAGNNRTYYWLDANMSGFQSQRYDLVVAATDSLGSVADYSSEGANVLVSAPSNGSYYGPWVATTDRTGVEGYNDGYNPSWDPVPLDYTTRFGGTSAAAPMVTGVVSLMLEANPDLGWRDVRDILAITARHTGTAMGEDGSYLELRFNWRLNHDRHINGAGLHYNQNYGFGLVDALAAVRLAESWTHTRTSDNEVSRQATVSGDRPIPEGGVNPQVVLTFDIAPGVVAQNVTLYLDLSHNLARELEVTLISPDGTESQLFVHQGSPRSIYGTGGTAWTPWTFNTNQFMGEDATGTWTLKIADTFGEFPANGVFHSATLTVYGDAASNDDNYIYSNEFGVLAGMTFGYTIDDSAGVDSLNASAVSAGSVLDLRGGKVSTINGQAVTITAGTVIENAWSGDGNDKIVGNTVDNRLEGMRGNDVILGREGDDSLNGGAGNDALDGGAGDDRIDGGDGVDRVSYMTAAAGVVVNLNVARQETGGSGVDWLYNIENIEGSNYADRLAGGNGATVLWGCGGDDLLHGHVGNDTLYGGDGSDQLDGDAGDDQLFGDAGSDGLNGGAGKDVITGGLGDDSVDGGEGDDLVLGGAGADTLDGGVGSDTASYAASWAGVTLNLTVYGYLEPQAASGGDAEGDLLYNFENVVGSRFNDVITGDTSANRLSGGDGNDTLSGDFNNDTLDGGAGRDLILGGDSDDIIAGGAGADTLSGGDGVDTLNYAGSLDAVGVQLTADPVTGWQRANGGDARGDAIREFENVVGGHGGDSLFGDGASNRLSGMDGADVIYGLGGGDTLDGGAGNDRMYGGDGDDRLFGGDGIDKLVGNSGSDAFIFRATDVVASGDAMASADWILDFLIRAAPPAEADRIDLRGIDAIAGGTDDAFTFIGGAAFSATGQVRAWFDGSDTVIEANTVDDTTGHVELAIVLAGINVAGTLTALDFAL
ncbi:MAG: S8 family serine peptidase, partial [Asticcacaulis sp.]|nr:S8 family serine peptidase [Asticcacaulis sp.]